MEREVRLEYLRPGQILEAKAEKSIVYLPVSPIEWHGPHNPVGVDGLHAYTTAIEVAKRFGGVVMPPFFAGLGGLLSEEQMKTIGFEEPYPVIHGMDYPHNGVPSMYWDEDVYHLCAKEQIRLLMKYGYRLIVTVANHGDLTRVAAEMSECNPNCYCIHTSCIGKKFFESNDVGHACKGESSIVRYLLDECVDLNMLPSKEDVPRLKNIEFGIVDSRTFRGNPNSDHTVEFDPRDATPEWGKELFESGVEQVLEGVMAAYEKIEHK